MTDRSIRVSDEERDRIAGLLRDAYATGRLDHAEFDERSAAAYSARSWGELSDLTADLPWPQGQAPDLPAGHVTSAESRQRRRAAGRRRGLLSVALLAVAGLLLAAPSIPAAIVLTCVLILCVLGGRTAHRW